MNTADLIARMDAQRSQWVDLPGGKRVLVRRPLEADFRTLPLDPDTPLYAWRPAVAEFVADWEGFTEADLLGAAIGASDAVPFSEALWERVLADRNAYLEPVVNAIVRAVSEYAQAQALTAKN